MTTLNPGFALNSVFRKYVWNYDALAIVLVNVIGELERQRTAAASRGFLAAA